MHDTEFCNHNKLWIKFAIVANKSCNGTLNPSWLFEPYLVIYHKANNRSIYWECFLTIILLPNTQKCHISKKRLSAKTTNNYSVNLNYIFQSTQHAYCGICSYIISPAIYF